MLKIHDQSKWSIRSSLDIRIEKNGYTLRIGVTDNKWTFKPQTKLTDNALKKKTNKQFKRQTTVYKIRYSNEES